MSDAMSFAQLSDQCVELLPARTVLSTFHAGTAANGEPGTHGAKGQSVSKFSFLGIFGWGGGFNPTDNSGDDAGSAGSGHA